MLPQDMSNTMHALGQLLGAQWLPEIDRHLLPRGVRALARVCVRACAFAFASAFASACVRLRAHSRACVCVSVRVYVRARMRVRVCVFAYVCVRAHACLCVCLCTLCACCVFLPCPAHVGDLCVLACVSVRAREVARIKVCM